MWIPSAHKHLLVFKTRTDATFAYGTQINVSMDPQCKLPVQCVNNNATSASLLQCTFHQLTGLVTLSPELLNLGINALRENGETSIR